MTFSQAVLSFAVVAGLLTLVPGIDTSIVLRAGLTRRRAAAFATAAGVCSGALVWGAAAAVGASALLAASDVAYRALTLAGAAYMVWLGASLIWKTISRKGAEGPRMTADPPPAHDGPLWGAWLKGAATNLLNPKVGVFYIATIPQFIPAGTSPAAMGLLLAAVHGIMAMAWFSLIIAGTGVASNWLRSPRSISIIDRITGTVLIGFGGRLALDPH
jgi:threonine/homoserine/homoserine lactone efflux protein